jgi:hypothetical protein
MRLPTDIGEREELYYDLIRQCGASRGDRLNFYKTLRSYLLFGAADNRMAAYNKIKPTVDLLTSIIYSPETTKFSLHLGAKAPREELRKAEPLTEEIQNTWHDSDTDLLFGQCLQWALCYGTTHVKAFWKNGKVHAHYVEPHNFGVLREDITDLEDQEAFCHWYVMSKRQLEAELHRIHHPKAHAIFEWIAAGSAGGDDAGFPDGLQRLLLSSGIGAVGNAAQGGGSLASGVGSNTAFYDYTPKVDDDLIEMVELYVWNDEINDYQIVTLADPQVVVFDRPNFICNQIGPFTKVCPRPLEGYYWGESFCADLIPLQDWRTLRMEEIKRLLSLQLRPPKALPGWTGISEEKLRGLNAVGGLVAGPPGAGQPISFRPELPNDVFAEIKQIDAMFEDMAGVSHVMKGQGESGVRAKGHADLLARLSSSRPKKMALVIEDGIEKLATYYFRLIQENDPDRFVSAEKGADGKPLTFLAEQFTKEVVVKVDAHSSSPIFVEDKKQDAVGLLEAHAITRARFIKMMDPPGKQEILEELKVVEAAEKAAKEAEQAQEQQAQQQKGLRTVK